MLSEYAADKAIVRAYFDAFKSVPDMPRTIFAKHGLGRVGPGGEFEIVDAAPLDKLTGALNELFNIVGPQKAFEMGAQVPNHAATPPATDLISAMQMFDIGYHMNHMKGGVPMFDPKTGTMLDGIGHYKCVSTSKHRLVMEVDTPFLCDLDRGIMQTWARRFERTALVIHLDPTVCRKNRSPRCRYEVSWK